MSNLRRLGGAAVLIFTLGASGLAGDNQPPTCAPGEVNTPPCASLMASPDLTTLGETQTPPAAESFDFLSLAETALALVF